MLPNHSRSSQSLISWLSLDLASVVGVCVVGGLGIGFLMPGPATKTVGRGCPHDTNEFPGNGFATLTTKVLERITVPGSQPWEFETDTTASGLCATESGRLTRVVTTTERDAQGRLIRIANPLPSAPGWSRSMQRPTRDPTTARARSNVRPGTTIPSVATGRWLKSTSTTAMVR
jgi:hypothetical protein